MGKTDILTAKRHRVSDRTGTKHTYITVCNDPVVGTPCEVWVTVNEENKNKMQKLKSEVTAVAALFSLSREFGAPYTKAVETMQGVCYSEVSIPAKILEILLKHCSLKEAKMLEFEASQRVSMEGKDAV